MEVLTKIELFQRATEIGQKILAGEVFIYPTDTIYGIGCDATNEAAVAKVRALKQRPDAPFSVWIPNLRWMKTHCTLTTASKQYTNLLPGPYTLILPLKKAAVAANVTNKKTLGIRLPDHWFHTVVEGLNIPLLTTSVNKHGEAFMTSLEDLDPDIGDNVSFIIADGQLTGRPSKIINVQEATTKSR